MTLTLAQAAGARVTVARAFETDPLIEWLFPDVDTRLERSAAWWGPFVEQYALHAHVDVIEVENQVAGVAM